MSKKMQRLEAVRRAMRADTHETAEAKALQHKKQMVECLMKALRFETTETRNSDSLDFKEVSVWEIKQALEEAYEAGKAQAGRAS